MKDYVWVASYQHRHGTDTRVFRDERLAYEWRNAVAKEYFEEEFPEEDMPCDDEVGKVYFDLMLDLRSLDDVERFEIEKCEVEG